MKFPQPRLKVRTMIGLVALAAVGAWGWRTYFDPVRLWQTAIRDKYDANSRQVNINAAAQGKIQGLDADLAVADLIEILRDTSQDEQVRSTAAGGLARFPGRAKVTIPALVAGLRDSKSGVRVFSAVAIRQTLGNHWADDPIKREAVAGLVAALHDSDRLVRHWSACTLGFIGEGKIAISDLIVAWQAPDLHYMERMQILNALSRSGPGAIEAVPAILKTAMPASVDDGNMGGDSGRKGNASALIRAALFLHDFGKTEEACALLRNLATDRDASIASDARKQLRAIKPDLSTEANP